MDLDTMLTEAAPARRASLDAPDSPAAVRLYQRITAPPAAPARVPRWRRFPVVALTSAAAAASAVVALALVSGSGSGPRPATATLAAWTVTREPNGLVGVTIRELRDPAGLRRMLRAAGVPVNVRFLPHPFPPTTSAVALPPGCQAPPLSDQANARLQEKIMPRFGPGPGAPIPSGSDAILVIRPSAIPQGIGLSLQVWGVRMASVGPHGGQLLVLQTNLVLASLSCTG